jgi:hypothetical protein
MIRNPKKRKRNKLVLKMSGSLGSYFKREKIFSRLIDENIGR